MQLKSRWAPKLFELLRQCLVAAMSSYREWQEARARANALLRECLTDDEYGFLQGHGYLEVASRLFPDRLYRVPGDGGRVKVYEHGSFSGELCVAPVGSVPASDIVLAHKLMIEACEEDYLHVARWIQPMPSEFSQFGLYYDFAMLRTRREGRPTQNGR